MGDLGSGIAGLGSMVGAGVSAGASLAGDAMQLQGAEQMQATQNQFNASQVQQQEQYQTQMSDTSYQRATADMQAAGINPMLAYMKGGASTPSGSAASAAPAPQVPNFAGDAANSALKAYTMGKQNDSINAEIANKQTANEVIKNQVDKSAADARSAAAEADMLERSKASVYADQDYQEKLAKAKNPLADVNALAGEGGGISNVLGRIAGRIYNSVGSMQRGMDRAGAGPKSSILDLLESSGDQGIAYPTPNN